MKVTLINPPIREQMPAYQRPFGLASIAQVLRDGGHDVEIYDINSTRHPREAVGHYLSRLDADIIGVGGLITTYAYLNFLIPLLREKRKNIPIVLGGGGITSAPEVFMENLRPDYGALGEGEYTMLELANGEDINNISGLVYYAGDKLKFNSVRPLEPDLDKFGMGAIDLLDMNKYASMVKHNDRVDRELAMIATRGCPRNCAFCYHIFERSQRYRSVESVVDEMEYLIDKYKVESIMFTDELFTARKSYVMKFCEEILGRRLKIEWSCLSRVDTIDEETMVIMAAAGCFRVGFGFESGSQRILDDMNKGVTVEQAATAHRLAEKYFRDVGGTFIYGMPGEDRDSLADNIRWCSSVHIAAAFYHLNPYPGTKVYLDNFDKIIQKYRSEHNYFLALGDAGQFVINLTKFTDDAYFRFKHIMEAEIRKRALEMIPIRLADGIPVDFVRKGVVYLIHPRHVKILLK